MAAAKGNKYGAGNKGGRPKEYSSEYHDDRAFNFCLTGMTDAQIALAFEIGVATLTKWKKAYEGFGLAFVRGREDAIAQVGRALFERAIGYQHPETQFFVTRIGKDTDVVASEDTIKQYPPEVKAISLYLANRTRAAENRWRERPDDYDKDGALAAGANGGSVALTISIVDPKSKDQVEMDIAGADDEEDTDNT